MLQTYNHVTTPTCSHSTKMLALLDTSTEDYRFDSLRTHVGQCPVCKESYSKAKRYVSSLNRGIPYFKADQEIQGGINSEIDTFIKGLEKVQANKVREKRMEKFNFMKKIASDLGQAVFSVALIKGCAWAALATLAAKWIIGQS